MGNLGEVERQGRVAQSGRRENGEGEDLVLAKTERHKKTLSSSSNFKQMTLSRNRNVMSNVPGGIYGKLENIWRQAGSKYS